jgi:hypothetical protein
MKFLQMAENIKMDEFTHYNSAPTVFGVFSVVTSQRFQKISLYNS